MQAGHAHNPAMARVLKWIVVALVLLVLLVLGTAFALHRWVSTDDFRSRVEREASAAIGVPVKLGALSVDVWPLPAVAVDKLRLQSQPPVTLERVEARPVWQALLQGRLEVSTLIVRDAVLPAQGISAIAAAFQKRKPPAQASPPPGSEGEEGGSMDWVPRRAVFERVTWVDEKGARTTVDAQLGLGTDGLLDKATFKITAGKFAGTEGKVERAADHWPVRVDIGGGRIAGKLQLLPAQSRRRVLQGQLDRGGAAACLCDELQRGPGHAQLGAQVLGQQGFVFGDEGGERHVGISMRARLPPPGWACSVKRAVSP